MTAHDGYLALSQQQDGTAQAHPLWWVASQNFITKNAGLLLVICSQFFFASMNLCVKLLDKLDPPTPTLEVVTIRMAITLCVCMIYMAAKGISDPFLGPKGVRGLLVARGLAGFVGIFAEYYALGYLPLADTIVITFVTPFVVALAGLLLLGESYTKKDTLAGGTTLALVYDRYTIQIGYSVQLLGVVLIARPPFIFGSTVGGDGNTDVTTFERLRAVGFTLISVGGQAMTYITMRAIGSRAHPMQIMTFFSFWCVIVGSIAMAMMPRQVVFPMTWQWITLQLILGLFSVIGQFFLTIGLRYDTATRCALGAYSQIPFAIVLQFVVLNTVPTPLSAAGMAIIVVAQLFAVFSKKQPPSSDDVEERPFLT